MRSTMNATARRLMMLTAAALLAAGCSAATDADSTPARSAVGCGDAIENMNSFLEDEALPWLVEQHPELLFDDSDEAYEKFLAAMPDDMRDDMIRLTASGIAACGEARWDEYLDS